MDKYLPTIPKRKQILLTQIDETQVIIYRTTLERRENEKRKSPDQVAADDFNIKNLKKKLDILLDAWEELDAENTTTTGSSSAVEGSIVQPNL